MVIVDSSVLVDLVRGAANQQTAWLLSRRYEERFGITTLTLCEVLQGFRTEEEAVAKRRDMTFFQVFEIGSSALAEASAHNFRELRRRGITIRTTIDCMIATFCIGEGYPLLHNDRDFDAFETHLGLQVLRPLDFLRN